MAAAIGVGAYANIGSGADELGEPRDGRDGQAGRRALERVVDRQRRSHRAISSVSFQQTGKVTAIFVKLGDHVTAGQQLAQIDDTQQARGIARRRKRRSRRRRRNLAGRATRRDVRTNAAQDAAGLASAVQSVAERAIRRHPRATVRSGERRRSTSSRSTRPKPSSTRPTSSLASAKDAVERAEVGDVDAADELRPERLVERGRRRRASMRYKLDQVTCGVHSGTPGYHTADGVDCSQIVNLISFATSVQTSQSSYTQAQSAVTHRAELTDERAAGTDGRASCRINRPSTTRRTS